MVVKGSLLLGKGLEHFVNQSLFVMVLDLLFVVSIVKGVLTWKGRGLYDR